jgi:osmotically-inducible protein OsmY
MTKYWEPPEAGVGGGEPIAPIPDDEPRSDGEITEGVKTAFFLDPDLSGNSFEVRTKDGIVYLKGEARTEQTKRRALELARGVAGVADVRDEISLREG